MITEDSGVMQAQRRSSQSHWMLGAVLHIAGDRV